MGESDFFFVVGCPENQRTPQLFGFVLLCDGFSDFNPALPNLLIAFS
jgi:hypothetical protein